MSFITAAALLPFFGLGFLLTVRFLRTSHLILLAAFSLNLTFALMILTVGISGRVFHRFDTGYWIGSALCLLAGCIVLNIRDTHKEKWKLSIEIQDIPLALFASISTILIVRVAWLFTFHDERWVQGHASFTESILHGPFPPVFVAFPDIQAHYHYGFNLLVAIISKAFQVQAFRGIDLVTILCWVGLLASLVTLLKIIRVPRRFWGMALVFITLSGGLSWLLSRSIGIASGSWQDGYVYGRKLSPHFLSYFFQHPMGLGFPLFFSSLYFFSRWFEKKRNADLAILSLLLGALSLSQVVLFATLMASCVLFFGWKILRKAADPKGLLLYALLLLGIVGILAFSLGGFFQFGGAAAGGPVFSWPPGFLGHEIYGGNKPITLVQSGLWYLALFGPMIFLVPWAWYRTWKPENLALGVLWIFSVMSFFIPQVFHYPFSWDIAKWFLAFEVSARLLIVVAVAPWMERNLFRQILAWIFILLCIVTPVRLLWDWTSGSTRPYTWPTYSQVQPPNVLKPLLEKMRNCEACRGMIWGTMDTASMVSNHTGYPVAQVDAPTITMPIPRETVQKRRQDISQLNSLPTQELLKSLQIRWVFFQCDELNKMPNPVREIIYVLRSMPEIVDYSIKINPQECYVILDLGKPL